MAHTILTGMFLSICSYTDIKNKVVYLKLMLPFLAAGIALCAYSGIGAFPGAIFGVMVGALLLLLSFATHGAIGTGDGLVLMVTGVYLGFITNIRLLCTALFLSALVSAGAVVIKKWDKGREIPFMPFLLAAFIFIEAGL